jgi:rod shape determining protein RodA
VFRKFLGGVADYIRETDKPFLLLCLFASLFGAVMVLSAGDSRQFLVQSGSATVGVMAAVAISRFDYGLFSRLWPLFWALTLGLVILTRFIGFAPEGTDNRAWLKLPGGMTLQPSELLKIALIISFAQHVTWLRDRVSRPLNVIFLTLHGLIPVGIIHFLQGDDGTAILFAIIFLAMLFSAGVKLRYFIGGAVTVAAAGVALWQKVLSDYQFERFTALFDPNYDPLGTGWQARIGRIAIGSGGITGFGLFKGPNVQGNILPKSYNDFIFAAIGEELGFVGCMAVLLILGGIMARVLRAGQTARDSAGRIICAGVFAMFAGQVVINVGMCLSLLPVIGVTLPFFSAGGSSLLCLFLGVGLVLSVYMHKHRRTIFINE